jgi:cytochrome c peroxidase
VLAFLKTQSTVWLVIAALTVLTSPNSSDAQTKPMHETIHERIQWTPVEIRNMRGLRIGALPALPADKSNAVADNPKAAQLGHQLFFDTRLSSDGQVSCASCHLPGIAFTDGRKLARGVGTAGRNAMTIVGTAYSPWFFWDGRKDSQWAQALGPLESAVEHGGDRTQYAHVIASDAHYRSQYEALFGPLPDLADNDLFPPFAGPVSATEKIAAWMRMTPDNRIAVSTIFANIGKAIAAYERLILPGPTRFDRYVEAQLAGNDKVAKTLLSSEEEFGLRLFLGPGRCTQCHNGPLFTNNTFHNTGLADPLGRQPDQGRFIGVKQVLTDEFNCRSRYSDASAQDCTALKFIKTSDPNFDRGFRTPTLRNVSVTTPYMHDGRFATLREVIAHYNVAARRPNGLTELSPLNFDKRQLSALENFLRTLNSAPNISSYWLEPPAK